MQGGGPIFPPRDTWQGLETFLIIVIGGGVYIYWAETRDAATHPPTHRTVPTTKKYCPKVSEQLRFLKDKGCPWRVPLILGKVASSN